MAQVALSTIDVCVVLAVYCYAQVSRLQETSGRAFGEVPDCLVRRSVGLAASFGDLPAALVLRCDCLYQLTIIACFLLFVLLSFVFRRVVFDKLCPVLLCTSKFDKCCAELVVSILTWQCGNIVQWGMFVCAKVWRDLRKFSLRQPWFRFVCPQWEVRIHRGLLQQAVFNLALGRKAKHY